MPGEALVGFESCLDEVNDFRAYGDCADASLRKVGRGIGKSGSGRRRRSGRHGGDKEIQLSFIQQQEQISKANQVQSGLDGSSAMGRKGVTDGSHQFGVEPGHPGAFVCPDGGKHKGAKRFDGHADLDLLAAADSIEFIGGNGVDGMDRVEEKSQPCNGRMRSIRATTRGTGSRRCRNGAVRSAAAIPAASLCRKARLKRFNIGTRLETAIAVTLLTLLRNGRCIV